MTPGGGWGRGTAAGACGSLSHADPPPCEGPLLGPTESHRIHPMREALAAGAVVSVVGSPLSVRAVGGGLCCR